MKDAKPYSILTLTRVGMFILLSVAYYLGAEDTFHKNLILLLMMLLITNHFFMFSSYGVKNCIKLTGIDFIICSVIGFIYGYSDSLYLIYFGVLAVTLFLLTNNKKIITGFSIAFLAVWIMIMLIGYIKTGVIHYWSNFLSFSFVMHGCLVGGLIRQLMQTKETVDFQYEELTESHVALTAAHEQLRDYSQQVEELTVIRERNRIAREIHDTVGHKMTALLIQMQLAQEMMSIDLEKGKQALEMCDQLAREALQEVRLSVRTIHDDEGEKATLLPTLKKMLHDFSSMTDLETSLRLEGDFSTIPTSIQPAIIRIVQESLTNAKRHGLATKCNVEISCSVDKVIIEVVDNGSGTENPVPGFGILNMRERVLEHGGSLQYHSDALGFSIKAEFPLKQLKWIAGVVS